MRSTRDGIAAAALACFARDGLDTPLRTIASEAGVSAALIEHHFGSKQGLRDAVDELVIGIAEAKMQAYAEQGPSAAAAVVISLVQDGHVPRYLARVLVDGSGAGERIFLSFVDVTEQALADLGLREARMTAALLVTHSLGALIMTDHLAAAIGTNPFSDDGLSRWLAAATQIYGGTLTPLLPR